MVRATDEVPLDCCGGAVRATGRLFETPGLAVLAAVMVTVEDCGAERGAVYSPPAEMEPVVLFPPAIPFTLQVTVELELPVTVAEYCDCSPSITVGGPVKLIATESLPANWLGLVTELPQAVRSSTNVVVRIIKGSVRVTVRILIPQATVKCQKVRVAR
jgi:hypothetical protein